jgi:tRNA (guanine10-N2)-dimethyltransferase
VNARPFFHPTSLQPKWARLLLNLSGVKRGRILDPFCGAGGILLEAGVMGLRAVGVDKDEAIVEGANENLWFFRVDDKCSVVNEDFFDWRPKGKAGRFDAIVTDLPYGRSSQLFGKKLDVLYGEAFKKMREHSKKAVIMGPSDLTALLEKADWRVEAKFDFYVHKTLRRWIHVCS